jgi:glutamate-5-semialdehyde dehydrogenase
MVKMDDSIDLLMQRGGSEYVSYLQPNTGIPVLGTLKVCHVCGDSKAEFSVAGVIRVRREGAVSYGL